MCGIFGAVKTRKAEAAFYRALDSIKHRGPDFTAAYEDNYIFIGHHRLTILDITEKGNQPMKDSSGRYIITYNGEIYNHADIRKILAEKGYTFSSSSDTETLLYGYIHFKEKILEKLNGIFAFAIYDTHTQDIFIARDALGIKPFYYYLKENDFAFASEIKAFIYLDTFDDTLNYGAFLNYMQYLWSPGEITPFQYVHKLLPGTYMQLNIKNISATCSSHRYYKIPFDGVRDNFSEERWIQALDITLMQAVSRQLMSDVPVGFFLSGGIDSSLLVSIVRYLQKDYEINCFTIKNTDSTSDEGFKDDFQFAKTVAKHTNAKLHPVNGDIDILRHFDEMIWHLDEPQADVAPLYVYHICKEAKEKFGLKVLLGGVGGDDVFSGYRRHQALYFQKYLQLTPAFITRILRNAVAKINTGNSAIRRIHKLLKYSGKNSLERMVGNFEWFPVKENMQLFSENTRGQIGKFDEELYFFNLLKQIDAGEDDLNKMLFLELNSFLVDHNLNYTDKMGMASGVEVRVPYLDNEVIKLAARMPVKYKMKGMQTKYILRKVAQRYLPHAVIYRSKTGFGAPVRKWVRNNLDEMIQDRLNPQKINTRGIFNEKYIWKLIDENKKGKVDASYTILALLAIESWLTQFKEMKTKTLTKPATRQALKN